MRVASLGSGSKGNATLIQAADVTVLVDCGFGLKDIESRLKSRGVQPEQVSAILVTHEHSDHLKGAPMLANRYGIPLYASHGTSRHFKRPVATAQPICSSQHFVIGQLDIEPVIVPHDSAEPTQFIFRHNGLTFGVLTDLGSITAHVRKAYNECDVLMLECNHDPEMLRNGPYPPSLKRRVAGNYGHLSNEQAAQLLQTVNLQRLNKVLISHISEKNNSLQLAQAMIEQVLDESATEYEFLTQSEGCDWITLNHN